jgi:hypothetical protein
MSFPHALRLTRRAAAEARQAGGNPVTLREHCTACVNMTRQQSIWMPDKSTGALHRTDHAQRNALVARQAPHCTQWVQVCVRA